MKRNFMTLLDIKEAAVFERLDNKSRCKAMRIFENRIAASKLDDDVYDQEMSSCNSFAAYHWNSEEAYESRVDNRCLFEEEKRSYGLYPEEEIISCTTVSDNCSSPSCSSISEYMRTEGFDDIENSEQPVYVDSTTSIPGNKSIKSFFPTISRKSLTSSFQQNQEIQPNTKTFNQIKNLQQLVLNPGTLSLTNARSLMEVENNYDNRKLAYENEIEVSKNCCRLCLFDDSMGSGKEIAICAFCQHSFCLSESCSGQCNDCQLHYCKYCIRTVFDRPYDCQVCYDCL